MRLFGIKPHPVHVGFVVDEVQLGIFFFARILAFVKSYVPAYVPSSSYASRALGEGSVTARSFAEE
jgi:hypothetical protein